MFFIGVADCSVYVMRYPTKTPVLATTAMFLTQDALLLDCSNDPLTNALDLPTIYNSLGNLKIMPDVQGDVGLFGDTDVANGVDGKTFSVNRRAAEGDTYLNFYVNDDQTAYIDSNWDISIRSNLASGVIELGAISTNIVRLIGTVNAIGEPTGIKNLPLRHYGYITNGAAQRYVTWDLQDGDDYYHLTKSGAQILGLKIEMPLDLVANALTTLSTGTFGDATHRAILGGSNAAVEATDGTRTTYLAGGGYGIYSAPGGTNYLWYGTGGLQVQDGTNTVYLADGTYAINATGPNHFISGTMTVDMFNGLSQNLAWDVPSFWGGYLGGSGGAAYFYDTVVNSVYLADGIYAINATGNSLFTGAVTITSTLGAGAITGTQLTITGNNVALFGDATSTGNYISVVGSNSDNTYDVFKGARKYPRFTLQDTFAGGSTFYFWNLGNQLRFGTNTSSQAVSAWFTSSGDAGNVTFNGNITVNGDVTANKMVNIGTSASINNYVYVQGSNADATYDVFVGARKYPRFTLTDTIAGGSSFNIWNLGNSMRFGTNTGSVGTSAWYTNAGDAANVIFNGNIGVGVISPTARIHLAAGTATAGTAPLKFTTQVNPLTTPEAGTIQYVGTNFLLQSTVDGIAFRQATEYINSATADTLDLHSTKDTNVFCGAGYTLELQTNVYEDLQFQVSSAKTNPANVAPTWETFTATTSEYAFSVDDEVDTYANEIPHNWVEGTQGDAHMHITTKAINNVGVRYAKFTVTFAYADTNEAWVEAPLTAELTIPNPTAALTNLYLDLGNLTLTNYLIGAQIKCRVKRIAATGGTEYSGDIYITQVGVHLQRNTVGSRAELIK